MVRRASGGRRAGLSRWDAAFRLVLVVYALAVIAWLSLAVLPPGWLAQVVTSIPGMGPLEPPPANPSPAQPMWQDAVEFVFSGLNVTLAGLLLLRRPDTLVPRLLGVALLGTAATFNLPAHRVFHLLGSPWPISAAHFVMHIASGLAYAWAVVLFPDGRPPLGRRLEGGRGLALVAVTTLAAAYVSWQGSFLDHPQFFVVFFGVLVPVVGVAAQAVRLRHPDGGPGERATARLLLASLLPAAAVAVVWAVTAARDALVVSGVGVTGPRPSDAVAALFPAVFALVPIVLVSGVARYRLWDLDRLVSGVLVYGLLALGFGAAYVVAVASSGWLAGGGTWWTVLVLALTVTALEPLRQGGRRWANRVVFGQVLTPSDALRNLATGLEQMTPAGGLDQVVEVAVGATRASRAELWLLDGPRLVRTATAPVSVPAGSSTGATADAEIALDAGDDPADSLRERGLSAVWPVRYREETLGLLGVVVPDGRLGPHGSELAGAIASHAGLMVHNALLALHLTREVGDLATRSSDLRRARRRLVAAQQAERLRMERDLHDGAQQSLVAAIIGLRLLASSRPAGQAGVPEPSDVREIRGLLTAAREEMDALLTGGTPRDLADLGLAGALRHAADVARRSGLAVDVTTADADAIDLPAEPATALYLCGVECLSNIAKHAHATQVVITLSAADGAATLTVRDDGVGFDQGSGDAAGGLHHLVERLVVLGGDLIVRSAPGRGTTFQAWVPTSPALASAGPLGSSGASGPAVRP